MNKKEFLDELKKGLEENGITSSEMLEFYEEAISDCMEEGMSEAEAVAKVGSIEEIIRQAKLEMPMPVVVKNKIKETHSSAKKKGHGAIWIVLSIIGFPVWFPILVAVTAVLFGIYVVLWALVLSFYAVEFAFAVSAAACIAFSFACITGQIPFVTSLALFGSGLLLAGIIILLWKPLLLSAKGMIVIAKEFAKSIKKLFL